MNGFSSESKVYKSDTLGQYFPNYKDTRTSEEPS